jgi:hypothetical protein
LVVSHTAKLHAEAVRFKGNGHYSCPVARCPFISTMKRNFENTSKTHIIGIYALSQFECAVAEKSVSRPTISQHMAKHQEWGHLSGRKDYLTIRVQILPLSDTAIANGADSEDTNWDVGQGDECSGEDGGHDDCPDLFHDTGDDTALGGLSLEQRNEMREVREQSWVLFDQRLRS